MTGYPRWIGLSGWHMMSRHATMFGYAALILGPGKVGETVLCEHRHRKRRLADACGATMAAERNATLRRIAAPI